jgi:hypothetical protein
VLAARRYQKVNRSEPCMRRSGSVAVTCPKAGLFAGPALAQEVVDGQVKRAVVLTVIASAWFRML